MLTLRIVSPERIVFTGEVDSVMVPGAVGPFEILNNHAPLISTLVEVKVAIRNTISIACGLPLRSILLGYLWYS